MSKANNLEVIALEVNGLSDLAAKEKLDAMGGEVQDDKDNCNSNNVPVTTYIAFGASLLIVAFGIFALLKGRKLAPAANETSSPNKPELETTEFQKQKAHAEGASAVWASLKPHLIAVTVLGSVGLGSTSYEIIHRLTQAQPVDQHSNGNFVRLYRTH